MLQNATSSLRTHTAIDNLRLVSRSSGLKTPLSEQQRPRTTRPLFFIRQGLAGLDSTSSDAVKPMERRFGAGDVISARMAS
jgi:hypothetical protein